MRKFEFVLISVLPCYSNRLTYLPDLLQPFGVTAHYCLRRYQVASKFSCGVELTMSWLLLTQPSRER
jgi:hypothetical protein